MKSVTIKTSDAYSYIQDKEAIKIARSYFKYIQGGKTMDGVFGQQSYTYLITSGGRFLTGMLPYVVTLLKDVNGWEVLLDDHRTVPELPDKGFLSRTLKRIPLTLRPYQLEAVRMGLKRPRGMFDLATGAGKSLILSTLAKMWNTKTLIVTQSKDLAFQLRNEVAEVLGEEIGLIGAGKWDVRDVTVGMVQTLTSKSRKKQAAAYMETVKYLIFDEVHHAQSSTWQDIGRGCKNAVIRHGFSGTCFATPVVNDQGLEDAMSDYHLIGHTGPVLMSVKSADLVKQGYLSRPEVHILNNTLSPEYGDLYTEMYERVLMKDKERAEIIARICRDTKEEGEQCIVFVDRVEHGEFLLSEIRRGGGFDEKDSVIFLHGGEASERRKEVIAGFKNKEIPVLIGTVLGEGLNFFAKVGINAGGGKSKKNVIQRLGRVLRKERDPMTGDVNTSVDNVVTYYDFADNGHAVFGRHGRYRERVYIDEGHLVQTVKYQQKEKFVLPESRLKIQGDDLKLLYSTIKDAYARVVPKGKPFKFKDTERKRFKSAFMYFCELSGYTTQNDYFAALGSWRTYLLERALMWASWDKASRDNFVGLLVRREDIEVYVNKQNGAASLLNIAGANMSEEWEF